MKTAFSSRLAAAMKSFRENPEYRRAEQESYRRFLNQMHARGNPSGVLLTGKSESKNKKAE